MYRANFLKKISYLILLVCMLSSVFYTTVYAIYPPPRNDYVNDFAKVLTREDRDSIEKMFSDLEKQTGIEAVVVTVESIKKYETGDPTIEYFARGLFDTWGIGHKDKNNGVLILLSVNDRKCRIELGAGYKGHYNKIMEKIMEEQMVPNFKEGKYRIGLLEGSQAVIDAITKEVSWFEFYKWHILLVSLIVISIGAGISCLINGKKGWGWTFFSIALFLLFILWNLIKNGQKTDGFGGGKSGGGGATGSW